MTVNVGLRFQRRDARALRALAGRVRQGELGERHVQVFASAAAAAETGEPLIVVCDDPSEALLMAQGYAQYGVDPPVVEELAR